MLFIFYNWSLTLILKFKFILKLDWTVTKIGTEFKVLHNPRNCINKPLTKSNSIMCYWLSKSIQNHYAIEVFDILASPFDFSFQLEKFRVLSTKNEKKKNE